MRLAYVTTGVAERAELAPGPFDAEWLLEGQHEFMVFADQKTSGSERLRSAGIPVHVSPKRPMVFPGIGAVPADHTQARILAQAHADRPIDAVVYDSERATDLAWYVPELATIPRGVALGKGAIRDLRLVADTPSLFRDYGRLVWSITGLIATADFIVADAPPSAFGLVGDLPPRMSVRQLPEPSDPPTTAPQLVAVVALSEDRIGLGTLVRRARDLVPRDSQTTVVIIHPDLKAGDESTREIAMAGCPESLRRSAIFTEPGRDGVAAALLAQADLVVAARPSDLALPAMAAAAAKVPALLLEGEVERAPLLADSPLPAFAPRQAVLVSADSGLESAATIMGRLVAEGDADAFVLHTQHGGRVAARLLAAPRPGAADLTVCFAQDPFYGGPSDDAFRGALAVSRRAAPTVLRWMERADSMDELIVWLLSLSNSEHATLLALPIADGPCSPLPVADVEALPAWITSSGFLPRPQLAAVRERHGSPPTGEGVRDWVQGHGWSDRLRIVLPWRWGLLERAMRGRW